MEGKFENHYHFLLNQPYRCSVLYEDNNQMWYFNGIYGFLEEHNKKNTWFLVKESIKRYGDRVIFFGDFNNMLDGNGKKQ